GGCNCIGIRRSGAGPEAVRRNRWGLPGADAVLAIKAYSGATSQQLAPINSSHCCRAKEPDTVGSPVSPSSVDEPMQTQNGGRRSEQANNPVDAVAIVIPVLNEAAVMPRLLRLLGILDPAPAEIIAVDGGSQDNTAALVRQSGSVRLIEHA